jgi:flagellar L-ring protein precursor FlgH
MRLLAHSLVVIVSLVAGCAYAPRPEPLVQQPMTARPVPQQQLPVRTAGAIYQEGRSGLLFEDRRPRHVGDILTIVVTEKADASKASATSASRNGKVQEDLSVMPKLLGGLFRNQNASLSGANALDAKGGANAANSFNAVITVTVVDVMPNGNLVVSGEKQMLINQGTEYIRFSGVVNPQTVVGTNTVLSTQVADARIEYSAKGFINEAQTMGWLQRFFLNVLPL